MAPRLSKRFIATNERGYRIAQDHPNSKLTDIEVDSLIRDRGPEDAPTMSYAQLAKRYGISKSGARDLITGRRRGQPQKLVQRDESKRSAKEPKVRVNLHVSLRSRAILHRLGGGAWIDQIAVRVDALLRRARSLDDKQAVELVLKEIGVTE